MTTTKHSLKYPEEIVDEYIKQGFKSIQLKFLNKIGFAQNSWKEIGYSAEEYLEFWKSAMDHIIKKNIEGTVIIERFSQLLLKKILTFNEPGFLDFRNPCGIALGQIAYNVNGDIYCCDEGRGFDIFNMGNVNTTSFKEYAKSPKTHKLVESSMLEITYCDTCIFKPFCGNCPVLNYAEQNNLISKIALNQRCKIMKGKFEWLFDKLMFDENARMVFNKWMKND